MFNISPKDGSFQLDEKENLLDALKRHNYEVDSQCCSGFCGACRIKILSGKVSYPDPPIAFVAADEILPCCCMVEENLNLDVSMRVDRQPDLFIPEVFDAYQEK